MRKRIISTLTLFSIALAFSMITTAVMTRTEVVRPGIQHATYVTSTSLEDLSQRSSIIAIGTVQTGKPSIQHINGRNPNNPEEVDLGFIGVGSVYQIDVERYLKGNGESTLPVVQFESVILEHQGQMTEVQRKESDFPLKEGTRYLLFLKPQAQAPDLLIGPAHPHRFVLSSGVAKAESPAEAIIEEFPDTSETELVARVEAIVN